MSAIEWTDETWNPVTGCSRVSPGCEHCYAETLSLRRGWSKKPWTSQNAAENVVLHPERLEKPLHWRKPRMVFANSMSDLFHERVPYEFIDRVFTVMALSPRHTYQVLTKRPERMRAYLAAATGVEYGGAPLPSRRDCAVWAAARRLLIGTGKDVYRELPVPLPGTGPEGMGIRDWPLPNVWLGVSVEDQRRADERIPILLDTPAAVRWISAEPLLDALSFSWALWEGVRGHNHLDGLRKLDWVVVGGESGPKHRHMKDEWALQIRGQCVEAGVPFFFKQWGGRTPKAGGRLLDGREWNEMPT